MNSSKTSIFRAAVLFAALLGLVSTTGTFFGATALAQDAPGLLDRMFGRKTGVYERQSEAVLGAFRPLVKRARGSVVKVMNGDDDVAWGAVVGANGLVVTKRSDLRENLRVSLPDDRTVPARIVAESQEYDLALLECEATGLTPIQWSSVDEVPVGTFVFTPAAGELPLAIGVVSVANRSIARVGVTSKAYLGVRSEFVDDSLRLAEVVPDTPAAKSGLKEGDVLLEVNGVTMTSALSLQEVLAPLLPDDKISVKIGRESSTLNVDVTLAARSVVERSGNWFRRQRNGMLEGELSQRRGNFASAFQHDTVLKPEDCGGPIMGLDGKALGINIARARRVASYSVPASEVQSFVEQAIANAWVTEPDVALESRIDALSKSLERLERDLELMERAGDLNQQIRDLDKALSSARGDQREQLGESKAEAERMLRRIQRQLNSSSDSDKSK